MKSLVLSKLEKREVVLFAEYHSFKNLLKFPKASVGVDVDRTNMETHRMLAKATRSLPRYFACIQSAPTLHALRF